MRFPIIGMRSMDSMQAHDAGMDKSLGQAKGWQKVWHNLCHSPLIPFLNFRLFPVLIIVYLLISDSIFLTFALGLGEAVPPGLAIAIAVWMAVLLAALGVGLAFQGLGLILANGSGGTVFRSK